MSTLYDYSIQFTRHHQMTTSKASIAIVYHYFEKDALYRDNFIFFLCTAWRKELDFYVIVSGETKLNLPKLDNVNYIRTRNFGQDFAGYSTLINTGALDNYNHLFFVNCTVRGPFVSSYFNASWLHPFLNQLTDDTHLCGATINILHADRPFHILYQEAYPDHPHPYSHVQSSTHMMTKLCFEMLRCVGFYERLTSLTKEQAVIECEIKMSQLVKANGWNISCVLPPYNLIDYRKPHSEINRSTSNGHPQSSGAYFGTDLNPTDTIFLKTGWRALKATTLDFYSFIALHNTQSEISNWSELEAFKERLLAELDEVLIREAFPL